MILKLAIELMMLTVHNSQVPALRGSCFVRLDQQVKVAHLRIERIFRIGFDLTRIYGIPAGVMGSYIC